MLPFAAQLPDEGDLRLWPLSNSLPDGSMGRLEIYLNAVWGTVCSDGFDIHEADLACSELGFLYADIFQSYSEIK